MRRNVIRYLILIAAVCVSAPLAPRAQGNAPLPPGTARAAEQGFPTSPDFLPIGVWLQNPRHAPYFRVLGINMFVALWKGPTEAQLAEIARNGMHAVVEQNDAALTSPNAHVIGAYMQADEPDNAQRDATGALGACVMPDEIRRRYDAIKARDASRPVLLNFGQGVANRGWVGRGATCQALDHDAYYREAARGADILSFDIYPATAPRQPHVQGRLELVGEGIANLKRWSQPRQRVWAVIGTSHVNDPDRRPTVEEIRGQVWMALIHGARGIVYFLHEWKPSFREDAIFRYPEIGSGLGRINAEITRLASVLNSAAPELSVDVESDGRLAVLARIEREATYIFAVNMTPRAMDARLAARGRQDLNATGVAIGEDRVIEMRSGAISDRFAPYGVHLYRLDSRR